jgi:hypothetical protein
MTTRTRKAKSAPPRQKPRRVLIVATLDADVTTYHPTLESIAEWLDEMSCGSLIDPAVCDDLDDLISDLEEGYERLGELEPEDLEPAEDEGGS